MEWVDRVVLNFKDGKSKAFDLVNIDDFCSKCSKDLSKCICEAKRQTRKLFEFEEVKDEK